MGGDSPANRTKVSAKLNRKGKRAGKCQKEHELIRYDGAVSLSALKKIIDVVPLTFNAQPLRFPGFTVALLPDTRLGTAAQPTPQAPWSCSATSALRTG